MVIFQSTLPVRGATWRVLGYPREYSISIHAPRAGSDYVPAGIDITNNISIHAPRAGSDPWQRP